MKYPDLLRAALLAAAMLGAGGVLAQSAPTGPTGPTGPNETTPGTPALSAPIVSDVAPAPAEDRASAGAIVLADSPVRARRENMSTRIMGGSPSPKSIARRVDRQAARSKTEADLQQMRSDQREEFQRRGSASLIAN